jgi:hypothetical protein
MSETGPRLPPRAVWRGSDDEERDWLERVAGHVIRWLNDEATVVFERPPEARPRIAVGGIVPRTLIYAYTGRQGKPASLMFYDLGSDRPLQVLTSDPEGPAHIIMHRIGRRKELHLRWGEEDRAAQAKGIDLLREEDRELQRRDLELEQLEVNSPRNRARCR